MGNLLNKFVKSCDDQTKRRIMLHRHLQ